jgi:phosphoribosylformylglycinamidine cyclo-ligase
MNRDLYKESGVDLDKANALVDRIRPLVRSTFRGGVITDIGGFGGLYSLSCEGMKSPVLVSSTDGVGTKLKVAFMANRHDTVGIDLVAMCVNDIAVQGARPLFFLDYLALGKIDLDVVEKLVSGIAAGCKKAGCALIGGETAEMPGFYQENEYDMAGFAVGIVENAEIIDGSAIRPGYQVLGLGSSGLHSNGFSLVRQIVFDKLGLKPDSLLDACGRTVAEELLEPTCIYVEPVLKTLARHPVAGLVHVTGGGFYDNIPRILPKACQAVIRDGSWEVPPIFRFLKEQGDVEADEMFRVFNCGVGLVMVVAPQEAEGVIELLRAMQIKVSLIGEIVAREEGSPPVRIV